HPHAPRLVMMVPVAILAVLATVGGFLETRALGFGPAAVTDFLASAVGQARWEGGGAEVAVTFLTMILATALFVWALYSRPWSSYAPWAQRLLEHKYYFDEIYDRTFVRPTDWVAAFVAVNFAPDHSGFQFTEKLVWIPQFSIFYRLGVDGISLWLVVLNAFLTVIAIAATPVRARTGGFVGLMLAMSGGLAGVFMATDLVLFYVFWEAMLIPAYFLLWLYGEGARPGWAALKFVLYTLVGSLLMLVGIIGEYIATGHQTFDLAELAKLAPSPSLQFALFFVFALAFAIKTPLFPFHSWLPDAYNAAPVPMLITFAGVMGKAGAYGFLRIAVPLFPQPVNWWDW